MEVDREILDARAAIVDAARQLLAGRLGVVDASRAITRHRGIVDPDMNDRELLFFLGVDSESDNLAAGAVLNEWHPSLREQKRKEVKDFEDFYRAASLRDAAILVERYAPA